MGVRGDFSGFECRIVVGVGRAGLTLTEVTEAWAHWWEMTERPAVTPITTGYHQDMQNTMSKRLKQDQP